MPEKTEIESIRVYYCNDRTELRFDWSNERHHAVKLDDTNPLAVRLALIRAVHLLEREMEAGKL